MLEQLKELLEMQRVLDESIFKEKGITEYPLDNMKVALFVELGELMNEFPTKFKHWKSSAADNREKGLVEYVDCLHFALSLANQIDDFKMNTSYENTELKYTNSICEIVYFISRNVEIDCYYAMFIGLFVLGKKLGFTWEEIYEAYKKKNAINYERLNNGY
mgnify:CR=1 FL=1